MGSSWLSQQEPVHRAVPVHLLFISHSLPATLSTTLSCVHGRRGCIMSICPPVTLEGLAPKLKILGTRFQVLKNTNLLQSFFSETLSFCLLLYKYRSRSRQTYLEPQVLLSMEKSYYAPLNEYSYSEQSICGSQILCILLPLGVMVRKRIRATHKKIIKF